MWLPEVFVSEILVLSPSISSLTDLDHVPLGALQSLNSKLADLWRLFSCNAFSVKLQELFALRL